MPTLKVLLMAISLVVLFAGNPSYATTMSCAPSGSPCTFTRDLAIWFGTLNVVGASDPNVDVVQLTDRITQDVGGPIFLDPAQDTRVKNGLAPWVDTTITDMQWVLAPSQNRPAQQNLLNAFNTAAAALNAAHGTGTLTISPSALHYGPVVYPVTTWDTGIPLVHNIGNANVTVFQQDATWTAPAAAATGVPTLSAPVFGALGVLLLGFALYGLRRRRIQG